MPERLFKAKLANKIIDLDGSEFDSCEFRTCILRYAGNAPYKMVHCSFYHCEFHLIGPASNTISHLAAMYRGAGDGGKALVLDVIHHITGGELGKEMHPITPEVAEALSA